METKIKGTVNCRYCGSEIAASAKICPTCKYFQSPTRNLIVFYAGITGFITLLISGFAFIADRTTDFYRNLTWKDDVRVLSLVTGLYPNFSVVVSNIGSGPVFVSDIVLNWRGGNASLYINERINAGDVFALKGNVVLPERDYDAFVYSRSGQPSQQVLEEAQFDHETRLDKHCFLTIYSLPDSGDIARMNDYYGKNGNKLVVESAAAKIRFFSLHSKAQVQVPFSAAVTFLRSSASRCQNISFG
jgi:hypothetical protein